MTYLTTSEQLISITKGIDMTSTGDTTVYTPGSSETVYVTRAMLVPNTITGASTSPTVWMTNLSPRDIFQNEDIILTADTQFFSYVRGSSQPQNASVVKGASGHTIKFTVGVAATATTFTMDLYLYGVIL